MIKKILCLILIPFLLTGCGIDFDEKYDEMTIGKDVESYQIDLRIYGSINNENIIQMYKIDNYKNKEFKIETFDNTYFIVDNITYKEVKKDNMLPGILNNSKEVTYEKVEEKIFKETDILLQGLKNVKSKKKIDNDITGVELEAYSIKIEDNYIKSLLKELGYNQNFNKTSGKVYLQDEKLYKVIYEVDDLTINATFFRINSIKELNIEFENNSI